MVLRIWTAEAGKSTPRSPPLGGPELRMAPALQTRLAQDKVTFAALQTRLIHTCATCVAPTPDAGVPITACARSADLCVQLCVSGPQLVWLDRVQNSGVTSGVAGRNRNLLVQLDHRTRVSNRLCLSGLLQLLALDSVQLSCSLHTAFAAVPWAPAVSFVASADAICLCAV